MHKNQILLYASLFIYLNIKQKYISPLGKFIVSLLRQVHIRV